VSLGPQKLKKHDETQISDNVIGCFYFLSKKSKELSTTLLPPGPHAGTKPSQRRPEDSILKIGSYITIIS
jgi:hypothetical protein